MMLFVLTLSIATVVGLAAQRLSLPGGVLIGAAVGAAAVTLLSGTTDSVPRAMTVVVPLSVGLVTGAMVTRDVISALRSMIAPAVLSGLAIIGIGAAIAVGLDAWGVAPPAAVLATSPGALSVLVGTAIDIRTGEVEVAMFHVVRLVLVVALAPWLLALQRRLPRPRQR